MVSLVVSIVYFLFAVFFIKFPPLNKNWIVGYRTPLSMKNQDTWDVAQKLCGYGMLVTGILNLLFGIWAFVSPAPGNTEDMQALFLVVCVLGLFIISEVYLRRIFNKDGSRKVNL